MTFGFITIIFVDHVYLEEILVMLVMYSISTWTVVDTVSATLVKMFIYVADGNGIKYVWVHK